MKKSRRKITLLEIKQSLPAIKEVEGFQPTTKQIAFGRAYRTALANVGNGGEVDQISLPELSHKIMGNDRTLYYKWKRNPKFEIWLKHVGNDYFGGEALQVLWHAVLCRAVWNSPQDANLFAIRYDPDFKPQTSVEHKVSGLRPPDAAAEQQAIQASKKRIESITKGEANESTNGKQV